MKKTVLFLFVLVMSLVLVSIAGAQGPSVYNSGFQVQNLSATDPATIAIEYYNQDGTIAATTSDTIAPNSSNTYFPIGAPAGFNGSVVINSDQPVAAITNVLADGFDFGASYGGFSAGSNSVSLPLIMKGNFGFDTWFNVQNAGVDATTVTVEYAGTACTESATIQPGAAATFEQASNACLTAGYVGAATVTTDDPLDAVVATVLETGPTTLFAYNGFGPGDLMPVMPLMQANNFGFHTGIQIQNQGTLETEAVVTYTPAPGEPGTECTETQTIAAGASATFALYAFSTTTGTTTSTCTFGEQFVGAAAVTSNSASQPLVGIINQTNFVAKGSAYSSFNTIAASDTIVMPLIMDQNFGFFTGFNVMNVGAAATDVSCSFTGSALTVDGTIDPGEALNHVQLNFLPAGYVGSATCTGTDIIGVVNELATAAGDNLFTYEAFNQ